MWRKSVTGEALGGLAANSELVLVVDRDDNDLNDVYRALSVEDGSERWTFERRAVGALDYGNGTRATPQIDGDRAYFVNAFGAVTALRLSDGKQLWSRDYETDFKGRDKRNPWGAAASPLLVGDSVIINPGGPNASLVALSRDDGRTLWKSPGRRAAFSSFIRAKFGGVEQIVGYDQDTLGGWNAETGERLWELKPIETGDFNVPTPIIVNDKLLVSTENNGTRLYAFDEHGTINPTPIATNDQLAPDTHSPIVLNHRVFGVWNGMHCLSLDNHLAAVWTNTDDLAFDDYAVVIGSGDRVLVISKFGELILLDANANEFQPLARHKIFKKDPGVYAHPALIGSRMILRGSREVVCVELDRNKAGENR
ncbi:MAG: PQQ-like beta-propeller repeat protein [Planctomycetales bacterium]|nr:PQQ-like beta-propeller repeat protein [Planctomycetales bacterium]